MEKINDEWVYTEETREAASYQFGCTCDSCCAAIADHPDRVTQTIDRLISNLPDAVFKLKAQGLTSLARQIQNDLDNLVYWRDHGGLVKKERSEMWRKQAAMYKEQHGNDTNRLARLVIQNIKLAKFKPDGCTCVDEPGDEYYCQVHGGEMKAIGQTLQELQDEVRHRDQCECGQINWGQGATSSRRKPYVRGGRR